MSCPYQYNLIYHPETFRNNSPGAWLERVCNKPFVIREKSETEELLTLKPGDCVIVPMDAIQKDPQHFPDPETLILIDFLIRIPHKLTLMRSCLLA